MGSLKIDYLYRFSKKAAAEHIKWLIPLLLGILWFIHEIAIEVLGAKVDSMLPT
ncbi:MAG: hypothetical protein KAS07_02790 [Candidatus Pacebacteria bacterium]|nr:hypothetical protein [Candidatus Paceibacterota bacterium]